MTKITIENDVPIIEKKTSDRKKRGNWGFIKEMQKGDSFAVENQRLAQNAYHAGRNRGFTMRMRQISGGYRVWRL